jgi:hypothetical protein
VASWGASADDEEVGCLVDRALSLDEGNLTALELRWFLTPATTAEARLARDELFMHGWRASRAGSFARAQAAANMAWRMLEAAPLGSWGQRPPSRREANVVELADYASDRLPRELMAMSCGSARLAMEGDLVAARALARRARRRARKDPTMRGWLSSLLWSIDRVAGQGGKPTVTEEELQRDLAAVDDPLSRSEMAQARLIWRSASSSP